MHCVCFYFYVGLATDSLVLLSLQLKHKTQFVQLCKAVPEAHRIPFRVKTSKTHLNVNQTIIDLPACAILQVQFVGTLNK